MLAANKINDYRQRLVALMRRVKGNLDSLRSEALEGTGGEASGGISNTPVHLADALNVSG
jgi:hypothetical protein